MEKNRVSPSSRIPCDLVGEFYTEVLPRNVHGKLIDLGCGSSPLQGAYRDHCNSFDLLDVESRLGSQELTYQCSLNEPLEIESSVYDVALLSDVLEHLNEPAVALGEIFRILKPEGTLIANVPFMYGIHEAPADFNRFTRFGLEHQLKKAGFHQFEITEIGGLVSTLFTFVSKAFDYAPINLNWCSAALHRTYRAISRLSVVKKIEGATGRRFPTSYGVVCRKKS
jgi:SAM-dependent methyltransferase